MIDWCEYHDKPIEAITEEEQAECPVPGYGMDCHRCVFITEVDKEGET